MFWFCAITIVDFILSQMPHAEFDKTDILYLIKNLLLVAFDDIACLYPSGVLNTLWNENIALDQGDLQA